MKEMLQKICGIVKLNGSYTAIIVLLIGLVSLVSGSFALNATLKADTKTENFEKVMFGTQITAASLMILVGVANIFC
jgi:hypothetical protein